jgi:hypothetical protein
LAGGCSGHTLAQAVDLRELGDVVVGDGIDGQVKLLVVVDLATFGQAIFLFFFFCFGWESFWLSKETDGCDFGWEKIGWM